MRDTSGLVPAGMSRRHFLRHLAATSLATAAADWTRHLAAHAAELRKNHKACILLWMQGGPSHLDTWDLKPGAETGGPFKPIRTAAPGIEVCEHLPMLAREMGQLSIIRTMSTREADHDRGTYLVHTNYVPNPSLVHPSLGSIVGHELGAKARELVLPHFVAVNTPSVGPGFLGMAHAPLVIQNPRNPVPNLESPESAAGASSRRRLEMFELVESNFVKQGRGRASVDHQEVYRKTLRMMNQETKEAFAIGKEVPKTQERFGQTPFGQGCLMARRLVERGVSFVEVGLGGWDNHQNIHNTLQRQLLPELDRGMSALVADLRERGLWKDTLVLWMGEFGGTPRINQNAGRDHWPRSWSVVLGGASIAGGRVVGKTSADGMEIADRPVGVGDLFATVCQALAIPTDTKFIASNGRPIKAVNDGTVVQELFT